MTDILVLAFFWLARFHGLGRIAALENLHARFFIGADDDTALLVEAQCMDIELTDIIGLGLEVCVVTIEPVHAPMRLEVCLLQDTPDAGATHGLQPLLRERRDQVIKTPPRGGTMIHRRFPGRYRQHPHALRGGKRAAADPSAGHLAGREDRMRDNADATGQPYGAHRPSRWPPGDSMGGLARRPGGLADS